MPCSLCLYQTDLYMYISHPPSEDCFPTLLFENGIRRHKKVCFCL